MFLRRKNERGQAPNQSLPEGPRRASLRGRQAYGAGRDATGQAFVETVIIFPILLLLIAGIVQFAQITTVQKRLLMAARYGVWLYSRGQSEDVVRATIIDFLRNGSPRLGGTITVECKPRWSWGNVNSITSFTKGMNDRVTVSYNLGVSPLLRPLLGNSITLREKCVVGGGTWYWGMPMW